jgi:diguanylate cyclase
MITTPGAIVVFMAEGDALLRSTARLIRSNIRSSDSAARYGGDEFAIILPNSSISDGLELGERLRATAQKMGHDIGSENIPPGEYTLSVGVASYADNGRTAEELLLSADHGELTAENLGKNRVCASKVVA